MPEDRNNLRQRALLQQRVKQHDALALEETVEVSLHNVRCTRSVFEPASVTTTTNVAMRGALATVDDVQLAQREAQSSGQRLQRGPRSAFMTSASERQFEPRWRCAARRVAADPPC